MCRCRCRSDGSYYGDRRILPVGRSSLASDRLRHSNAVYKEFRNCRFAFSGRRRYSRFQNLEREVITVLYQYIILINDNFCIVSLHLTYIVPIHIYRKLFLFSFFCKFLNLLTLRNVSLFTLITNKLLNIYYLFYFLFGINLLKINKSLY